MVANLTTRLGQLTSSPAGGPYTGANKIINGDMAIDQRYGGTAYTAVGNSKYVLDRWGSSAAVASKYTVQQVADAPTGFTYSMKMVSLAAFTVGASDYYGVFQPVEGFNFAEFNFGTANAQSVTASFWVKATVAGTYGGVLYNAAATYTYPFTYAATTAWTKVSFTIPGQTAGVWATTNTTAGVFYFSLGVGTTTGTAFTWANAFYLGATTGTGNIFGHVSDALQITGVKLEVGSIATPFVPDDYQVSLGKCQRYYRKITYPTSSWWAAGVAFQTTNAGAGFTWGPTMRAAPAVTLPTTTLNWDNATGGAIAGVTTSISSIGLDNFRIGGTAASGWVAGNATLIEFTGNLIMDAEL